MSDLPTPSQAWFPVRRYGWGWGLPQTWQGWAVLAVWLAVMMAALRWARSDASRFYLVSALDTAALLAICWWKGEPPRWHWGD